MTKVLSFFKEVQAELKKVVWPSRRQVIKLTGIVVGVSVSIAFYISVLDLGFTKLVDLIVIK